MSKFLLFKKVKVEEQDRYNIVAVSDNLDKINDIRVTLGPQVYKQNYMMVEVCDDIDSNAIKVGMTLNRKILDSYLKNMKINPLDFIDGFLIFYEMEEEERSLWTIEKRIKKKEADWNRYKEENAYHDLDVEGSNYEDEDARW